MVMSMAVSAVSVPCTKAASPLDETISAIKSLFTPQRPLPPVADGNPGDAEAAYRDALRLRRQGAGSEALERLRDAAGAGHAGACYELGLLYGRGREVEKDLALGAQWINRAADLGDARAQFLVGANLMSGTGVPRDPSRGVAFLARAGEQGHVRAQYLLGQAYDGGIGVPLNPAWAARWYGRAALAGHAGAQVAYAGMLSAGRGLPGNEGEAYRWLLLAAQNGAREAGRGAARLAARLPASVVSAQRLEAARYKPHRQARLDDRPTVTYVQFALRSVGYEVGPVDGEPGRRTTAGIRAFQRDAGAVDGGGAISNGLLQELIARTATKG